jgi:transcriptional pleiotropic regulator of transition state genes
MGYYVKIRQTVKKGEKAMRKFGVVRPIDELGRIVLPREFRKVLGMNPRDELEISLVDNVITIKKYDKSCVLCGSEGDNFEFNDKTVCLECLKKLRNI